MSDITLQISTAPTDTHFLNQVLNHQIKVLNNQVNEILITADIRPSKGRFSFSEESIISFKRTLDKLKKKWPDIRIEFVDYSTEAMKEVAENLWGRQNIPIKDYRGGPFYSYFFGIHQSRNDHFLHLDSDILLGGASQTWCKDALSIYDSDPSIIFIKPLSGPPPAPDNIPSQFSTQNKYKNHHHSYVVNTFTTRSFLSSKTRLKKILGEISFESPGLLRLLYAVWNRNPLVKAPEELISTFLRKGNYYRLDYLGNENGLWTLHPPFRSEEFFYKLPYIITAVEKNRIPVEQRGHFDINHAFVDWTDAINKLPLFRRYKAKQKFLR